MRAIVAIAGFATFLLAVAAAAALVGVHDATLTDADAGVATTSAALVVLSATLAVAAAELLAMSRRRTWERGVRPPCKLPVLIAFLFTFFLGVYVLFSTLRSGGDQWPVVVAVAALLIVVPLAGMLFFLAEAQNALPRFGGIALGLIGIAIGASEFWFQNHWVPQHAGRDVSLKVDLRPAGRHNGFQVVRATVDYEDVGGRSVAVIGSAYTLTGSRLVPCRRAATTARVKDVFNGFLPDPQRSRFMGSVWERKPPDVLAAGKFVGDGKRLEPNVPAVRELVFLAPSKAYQLLRFRAQLFAIPSSVHLSQRTFPEYKTFPGDHALYGFWQIDDSSWLHDLVYGRNRWVVLRYELVDRKHKTNAMTSPDLRVTARFPDPAWDEKPPNGPDTQRLFANPLPDDASEPFADTELAVAPIAASTPRGLAGVPRSCGGGG